MSTTEPPTGRPLSTPVRDPGVEKRLEGSEEASGIRSDSPIQCVLSRNGTERGDRVLVRPTEGVQSRIGIRRTTVL